GPGALHFVVERRRAVTTGELLGLPGPLGRRPRHEDTVDVDLELVLEHVLVPAGVAERSLRDLDVRHEDRHLDAVVVTDRALDVVLVEVELHLRHVALGLGVGTGPRVTGGAGRSGCGGDDRQRPGRAAGDRGDHGLRG